MTPGEAAGLALASVAAWCVAWLVGTGLAAIVWEMFGP